MLRWSVPGLALALLCWGCGPNTSGNSNHIFSVDTPGSVTSMTTAPSTPPPPPLPPPWGGVDQGGGGGVDQGGGGGRVFGDTFVR